ncbi:MAG: hypothetical protein ACTSUE_06355 [Promethearchaeota archaeon]
MVKKIFFTLFVLFLGSATAIEFGYYYDAACDEECNALLTCDEWATDTCIQSIPWDGPVDTDDLTDCGCDCSSLDKDIVASNGTCDGVNCFMLCEESGDTHIFYTVNVGGIDIDATTNENEGCALGVSSGEGCLWLTSMLGSDGNGDGGGNANILSSWLWYL